MDFFNQLHTALEPSLKNLRKSLSTKDQLLLFYYRLKTAATLNTVCVIFGISERTASEAFCDVLDIVYDYSKKRITWLTKEENKALMPDSFRATYPECRIIIDASETKIEKPTEVDRSIKCYSQYKSGYTLKYLVGIAPCGLICFVSKTYGGRITDGQLTAACGIIDKLEPGDMVMSDKGIFIYNQKLHFTLQKF